MQSADYCIALQRDEVILSSGIHASHALVTFEYESAEKGFR